MALTEVFSRAKEARDRALDVAEHARTISLETTGALTEQARDASNRLTDHAKELTDQAREATGKLADAGREQVQNSLNETLSEIQALRGILARSGFSVDEVGLSIAIAPIATLKIQKVAAGDESLSELEKEPGLSRVQTAVINALNAMENLSNRYGYVMGAVEAQVGLTPAIKVQLKRADEDEGDTGAAENAALVTGSPAR